LAKYSLDNPSPIATSRISLAPNFNKPEAPYYTRNPFQSFFPFHSDKKRKITYLSKKREERGGARK
jgi:hypothetical protein